MSEIEQLRKDIATLEAAQNLIADGDGNGSWLLHDNIVERKKQLAKLEAEAAEKADPWKYAKDAIPLHISNGGNRVSIVAKYAKHLEQRVAELEQHVAALKQAESIDIFDSKKAARQDARIAELEAKIEKMQTDYKATYDGHQTKIVGLQAQLAKRPVVWCAKFKSGEMVKQTSRDASRCYREHTALYWSQSLANGIHPDLQIVPYTGEQS